MTNFRHGYYGTPTHTSWQSMHGRCSGRLSTPKYYAEKGVTVCARWARFEEFLADMGERPEGMTLDRIDRNGNYEPSNCRWATKSQQMQNKGDNVWLELAGERLCLSDWARKIGLDRRTISARLAKGWPASDALNPSKNFRHQRSYE